MECRIDACSGVVHAKQMCNSHYRKARRNNPRLDPVSRFWRATRKGSSPDDCWIWTRGTDGGGYGAFSVNDRSVKAHRFAYELLRGPIAENGTIDHLCEETRCVNPAHMEVVSANENVRRRWVRTNYQASWRIMEKARRVGANVEERVRLELEQIAEERSVTISQVVREALDEFLAANR